MPIDRKSPKKWLLVRRHDKTEPGIIEFIEAAQYDDYIFATNNADYVKRKHGEDCIILDMGFNVVYDTRVPKDKQERPTTGQRVEIKWDDFNKGTDHSVYVGYSTHMMNQVYKGPLHQCRVILAAYMSIGATDVTEAKNIKEGEKYDPKTNEDYKPTTFP